MRLPWGQFKNLMETWPKTSRVALVGCLSFEERCLAVPRMIADSMPRQSRWLLCDVHDPKDAYPDYTNESRKKTDSHWNLLGSCRTSFERQSCDLLATEDDLLETLGNEWYCSNQADIVVLDISSFPKRYFCFFLKRLLLNRNVNNLIVTYTEVGKQGYSEKRLCDDPLGCEHLPGYGALHSPSGDCLVVSVGFESLNISSLVQLYREDTRSVKFILAFPPGVDTNRRQWDTLLGIAHASGIYEIQQSDVDVISLWDCEYVHRRLGLWLDEFSSRQKVRPNHSEAVHLSLAPFGPKPHTLAMALFAIQSRSGMYYTQPKSYNPDYSTGIGQTWFYAVKWDGITCYDRKIIRP